MFKLKNVVLLFIVGIVLAACGAGPHAVRDGKLRDLIFSVETKENGSHFVWMMHDDVGVYCTMNDELFNQAEEVFDDTSRPPEIILSYISRNTGSAESPAINILGTEGCKHEKATVYVITAIQSVSQR